MDESPLHTHLLKRSTGRVIGSSDEEDGVFRPPEAQDSQAEMDQQNTPSDCSSHSCVNGGSSHQARSEVDPQEKEQDHCKKSPSDEEPEVDQVSEGTLIKFTYHTHSPWDSEEQESDTSTPDFKHGKHELLHEAGSQSAKVGNKRKVAKPRKRRRKVQLGASSKAETIEQQAVREILNEGIRFTTPKWIRARRARGPSLLILVDSQLGNWPGNDKICQIQMRKNWPLSRWSQAIKTGDIGIHSNNIFLYLESTRNWLDVPPIKNALHSLCKVIRSHANANDPRIYISNHLPRISGSPLRVPIHNLNFTQQQAIRSVGRALGRVFEVSVHEHFVSSRKGRVIKPVHKYFIEDGALSQMGCMVFRECVLRETGLKSYWF